MIIKLEHMIILGVVFCISCAVLCWAIMRMGFFAGKRSRGECINIAKKRHKPTYALFRLNANFLLPGLIVILVCCGTAYARLNPNVDQYTYLKNNLAEQRNIEVLFQEESVDTTKQEEQSDRIKKLHIPERFIGQPIDDAIYNYFYTELSQVYINGTKAGYRDSAPVIASDNAPYDNLDSPSIQEAKQYRDDYNNHPNQGSLYQYGRALSEFEPKGSDLLFSVTLLIMSESLYSMESFLEYADRNVNSENMPVEIDAYQIALMEGKMFLSNSKLAVESEEGAAFSNCFLVEALVSFEIGLSQIDSSNKYYVLLSYYVGNAGQNILYKIDQDSDPELYSSIGNKSMRAYQDAQKLYTDDPTFYAAESGMMTNIENGIQTLMDLGIHAGAPAS